MTDTDRIAQMAREAGLDVRDDWAPGCFVAELARFARLVAEDCADIVLTHPCEERSARRPQIAEAIRARYSKP